MATKRGKELEKELRQTRKHRSFWVNIGLLDDVRTAVEAGLLKDPTSGATLKSFNSAVVCGLRGLLQNAKLPYDGE